MKTMNRFAVSAVAAAVLLGLGGCSGMSTRDQDTAIGAGVGAVGGAVLTGGSESELLAASQSAALSVVKSVNPGSKQVRDKQRPLLRTLTGLQRGYRWFVNFAFAWRV
jgi:osmotically inducible lipoprotein OsmB